MIGHTSESRAPREKDARKPPRSLRASLPALRAGDPPPALVFGDLTLVRPLSMAGIPVVVLASDEREPALRTRYAVGHAILPPMQTPDGADALLALGEQVAERLGRTAPLVFGSDAQLEAVYRERDAFGERFAMLLNERDLAWALFDKARFYALCEQEGIDAPRSVRPGEDVASGTARLRPPFVVKPRSKEGWHALRAALFGGHAKARTFATRDELLATPGIAEAARALVIQELVPGDVGDLVSFHAFADDRGEILASFTGRKIRTFPAFGGESCFIETTDDPGVERAGRAVAERLGLRGPFKIDMIRDTRDGRIVTLEVNARPSLWGYLGAVHGVNLPAIAYEWLVHGRRPTEIRAARPRVRWLHLDRDLHALLEARRNGELGLFQWARSVASGPLVHDVFAWDDPAPFLSWSILRAEGVVAHLIRGRV